ncbi:hypothetical protein O3M35_012198 [Rhynocoris fuscipes]|uniref:Uncharacterized protein n=1 Tax=Rhynocoris fuscipes TaxID=488301 RepID=A0AAW1CXB6_9HEMI
MNSFLLCILACVAYVSATGIIHGAIPDDGQWRPWLDGSILGASPGLATATLGAASVGHGLGVVGAPALGLGVVGAHGLGLGVVGAHGLGLGALGAHGLIGAGHLLHKRSLGAYAALGHAGVINPNALNVPLDTVHVAAAKNAQLISQASEGARNILGGGIPAALPADTHEVAVGKVAHAIAHDTERAAVAARGALLGAHGVGAGILGAAAVAPVAGVRGVWGAGLGAVGAHGLGLGVVGAHGLGLGALGAHGWAAGHGIW